MNIFLELDTYGIAKANYRFCIDLEVIAVVGLILILHPFKTYVSHLVSSFPFKIAISRINAYFVSLM